jgi:hypothetical protein
VASWLVLTVMHWCLEFRTQEQQNQLRFILLTEFEQSQNIKASEIKTFSLSLIQTSMNILILVLLLNIYCLVLDLLLLSFTSQQCLESDSFMLQSIESSDLSFCLSTFTTLMRTQHVTTFNDDDDEENDNQSVWWQENFILTRFWKEHDETESQNSHRFSNELTGLNPEFCHSQNH